MTVPIMIADHRFSNDQGKSKTHYVENCALIIIYY